MGVVIEAVRAQMTRSESIIGVISEDLHVSWTESVSQESGRFHFPRGYSLSTPIRGGSARKGYLFQASDI